MNFENKKILLYIVLAFIFYVLTAARFEMRFGLWVRKNWNKKRTPASYLSSFIFLLSIFFLLFSLMDLRGKPEKIKSEISRQKTLILIDTSESMLAEDIRPNRISKAIILAKHFVKKAVGHEVGVIVFSDISKKLIPFTTDTDLIESRLDSLINEKAIKGGTSLSLALMEAVSYFTTNDGYNDGNILLITDAEETDGGVDFKIPEKIALAVIGIGSLNGGQIPIRSQYGSSSSVKMYNGKPVETKLDENFLKKLGSQVKHYRFWVATSYAMPTEEVVSFFGKVMKEKTNKGDATIKKVIGHHVAIVGMILMLLSLVLKRLKWFKPIASLVFILSFNSFSEEQAKEDVKSKFNKEFKLLKEGKLNESEKQKLYENMLRNNYNSESSSGYLDSKQQNQLGYRSQFNLGTSLLKEGKTDQGLKEYADLKERMKKYGQKDESIDEAIKKNTLVAYQNKKDKDKNKNKEKKDNKEEKENKDKQENQENKNNKEDGKNSEKDKQNKKENDDKNKDDENKKNDQSKNENKNNNKDKENDGKPEQKKSKDESSPPKGIKRKLPAMLKQLMNSDRELQLKLLDTSTKDRNNGPKRDW